MLEGAAEATAEAELVEMPSAVDAVLDAGRIPETPRALVGPKGKKARMPKRFPEPRKGQTLLRYSPGMSVPQNAGFPRRPGGRALSRWRLSFPRSGEDRCDTLFRTRGQGAVAGRVSWLLLIRSVNNATFGVGIGGKVACKAMLGRVCTELWRKKKTRLGGWLFGSNGKIG
ncbi:hypothetical protein LSM04_008144 [Trypanosoma melophagium]|uniref:uncharacterized protein n=1 Tax=Trypanosoma melophagium TaxID=715481 RepID=UPI00351A1BE7|nr:hypothetical protein LSM04_008144 [Trypanosoma melophagium]